MGRARIFLACRAVAPIKARCSAVQISMPLVVVGNSRIEARAVWRVGRIVTPAVAPKILVHAAAERLCVAWLAVGWAEIACCSAENEYSYSSVHFGAKYSVAITDRLCRLITLARSEVKPIPPT